MASSTDKAPSSSEQKKDEKEAVPPQLGALEEDDEFEEFPVQDWDDTETDLSRLTSVASAQGGTASTKAGDNLWEDNWDDDDVEDDFSVQLRNELAKSGKGVTGGDEAMAT